MANNLNNSILYNVNSGVNRTSTSSEYNFYYDGDFVLVQVNSSNTANAIGVMCDGAFLGYFPSDNGGYVYVTLLSGLNKYVRLIQTAVNHSTFTSSVYFKDVFTQASKFTRDLPATVSKRIGILSDSIGQGYSSTTLVTDGYGQKLRYNSAENVTIMGWSGAGLYQFGANSTVLTKMDGYITDCFSDTTTTKELIINLGTNDYGLFSTSAAAVQGYLEAMVDSINTLDSSIDVFVLSPFFRDGETSLLADYRTAFNAVCSTRAWCTYIEGGTIIGTGDLADGLHPTSAGHTKIYDVLKLIV